MTRHFVSARATNNTSELPGKIVEERNALKNSPKQRIIFPRHPHPTHLEKGGVHLAEWIEISCWHHR